MIYVPLANGSSSTLISKLRKNRVWSIAVYVEDGVFSFERGFNAPVFVLDSRRKRASHRHVHTYADPFLFPHGEYLYMFYEVQASGEHGRIEVKRTRDLVNFEWLGIVLKEPFHLSFPFIFEENGEIYMMPETLATEEVALYRFDEFPLKPVKDRVLLRGAYKDSSLTKHDGIWYFFTTSDSGLELYYIEDLAKGHLIPHARNPITDDPRYSQCGGSPIMLDGQLYRIAQDGSGEYGRNISILEINELSRKSYSETVVADHYFELEHSWNARGGHHLSIAGFDGKTVIAVDGKQDDLWINKLLAPFYRFFGPVLTMLGDDRWMS